VEVPVGGWRPRFIESETEFYSLHPRLRDFLNDQFGTGEKDVGISKDKDIQFRNMLINISYKILSKLLPHTTNPHLLIIDEDNYKNIKCPIESNKSANLEILSGSFFYNDLFKQENKIYNNLLVSVDYFYILGKKTKQKALCDIQIQDISRIKNYIQLSIDQILICSSSYA
jgi:hypothetical protein